MPYIGCSISLGIWGVRAFHNPRGLAMRRLGSAGARACVGARLFVLAGLLATVRPVTSGVACATAELIKPLAEQGRLADLAGKRCGVATSGVLVKVVLPCGAPFQRGEDVAAALITAATIAAIILLAIADFVADLAALHTAAVLSWLPLSPQPLSPQPPSSQPPSPQPQSPWLLLAPPSSPPPLSQPSTLPPSQSSAPRCCVR